MHPSTLMRLTWLVVLLELLAGFPHDAAAQDEAVNRAVTPAPGTPVVSVAASVNDIGTDDVTVSAKRFSEQLSDRLPPVETLLQSDAGLRSAGALVGLSAAAVGVLRGQRALVIVGAEAIRIGLDRQLATVRARTGLSVAPSLGDHRFAVTISRNF